VGGNSVPRWHLEGTYFENCNCELICPCIAGFGLPADNDRCVYVFAFAIAAGDVDGVDVSGCTAVVVGDADPYMEDVRSGLLVGERATAKQRLKLADALGERWEGEFTLGVETAAIEISQEERRHSLRVGEQIELVVEDSPANDGSGPRWISGLGHFVASRLVLARATVSEVNAFGFEFSNVGKNAHSAPFSWSG
jgi:hypothetical protein